MITRAVDEGRYAQPEREQRWLLSHLPDDRHAPVSIVDRYIPGTRLRLRRMESVSDVTYKLGQKVRPHPESPARVNLTNMYLSEGEYSTLLALGGDEIRKTRWHWMFAERTLAIDVFGGALAGLILAEIELSPEEPKLENPSFAVGDVTDDDRFSGGRLARTTPEELHSLLSAVRR